MATFYKIKDHGQTALRREREKLTKNKLAGIIRNREKSICLIALRVQKQNKKKFVVKEELQFSFTIVSTLRKHSCTISERLQKANKKCTARHLIVTLLSAKHRFMIPNGTIVRHICTL